jgi:hypothetical protein
MARMSTDADWASSVFICVIRGFFGFVWPRVFVGSAPGIADEAEKGIATDDPDRSAALSSIWAHLGHLWLALIAAP